MEREKGADGVFTPGMASPALSRPARLDATSTQPSLITCRAGVMMTNIHIKDSQPGRTGSSDQGRTSR